MRGYHAPLVLVWMLSTREGELAGSRQSGSTVYMPHRVLRHCRTSRCEQLPRGAVVVDACSVATTSAVRAVGAAACSSAAASAASSDAACAEGALALPADFPALGADAGERRKT